MRLLTSVFLLFALSGLPGMASEDRRVLRSFIDIGQHRAAIEYGLSRLKKNSEDSEFLFLIARAYQELKLNQEALQFYSESIALNRRNHKAYINRGLTFGALSNLRASTADLRKAIALNPNSKEAHLNLGFTQAAQNDTTKAIVSFTKALTIDPSFTEALRNRGITYHHLGKKQKACEDWINSAKIQKDDVEIWINEYCDS